MVSQPGLVTVFGGSGFVGRHIVRALARRGYRIRVAVRKPNLALFLKTAGSVGQVETVQANIRDDMSVAAAMRGATAVVNTVGILKESGRQKFSSLHADGAARVARLAQEAGVESLVQLSAIGADAESDAVYAQTKAAGEAAVRSAFPAATILRPSIVFGPEDQFFNRFANLARFSPFLPAIGPGTRFQPVYARDVAEAAALALEDADLAGRTYELGGPGIYTFVELMHFILDTIGRKRLVLPVPVSMAYPGAVLTGWLPGAPVTADQLKMLQHDNVVSAAAVEEGRTLEGLGITPQSIEAIVPAYLYVYRRSGQFEQARSD